MILPIFQVDAFADKLFGGNPAAVCPLEFWLPDELLQQIAAENNLAETAFFCKWGERWQIRWFTPALEVDLCGHATLATAHVIFNHLGFQGNDLIFESRSGILKVYKDDHNLVLDFPADSILKVSLPIKQCFPFTEVLEIWKGKSDYLFVFENEEKIASLVPDFSEISKLDARGVIVTAPGKQCDFVSRFFAPQAGIHEDPVTGSAHTTLAIYWQSRLGKNEMTAHQISKRGGKLKCRILGERVLISGQSKTFLIGEMYLPD